MTEVGAGKIIRGYRRRGAFGALVALVALAGLASVSRADQVSSAGLRQECVKAGEAGPRVVEGLLRHPGDKKTQSASLEADWPAMPTTCAGSFRRVARVKFQIQSPAGQWVAIGGWMIPERDSRDVKRQREEERLAEGKDPKCVQLVDERYENVCDLSVTLRDEGGTARAYANETKAKEFPFFIVERQRYRCTPGRAVTQARALVGNRVVDVETKKVVGEAIKKVKLEVVRVGYVTPAQKARGHLLGPC